MKYYYLPFDINLLFIAFQYLYQDLNPKVETTVNHKINLGKTKHKCFIDTLLLRNPKFQNTQAV